MRSRAAHDAATGAIVQRVPLPAEAQATPPGEQSPMELKPDKDGQVSYTGLVLSRDGARIYLSNVRGSVKVFAVATDGKVTASHTIPLPKANPCVAPSSAATFRTPWAPS